jgi:hypothetical protein
MEKRRKKEEMIILVNRLYLILCLMEIMEIMIILMMSWMMNCRKL